MHLNQSQLKKRKDGADSSCAIINPYDKQIEQPRRKLQVPTKNINNYMSQPKKEVPIRMSEAEEYLKQAYEDEDFMEEARTNEEMYEDQILQAQALMGKLKGLENGSAFFNDECYDQESN